MIDCKTRYFIRMLLINICILITIDNPNDEEYGVNLAKYVNSIWANNRVYA